MDMLSELGAFCYAMNETKIIGERYSIAQCTNCGGTMTPEYDGTLLDLVEMAMKHHKECH